MLKEFESKLDFNQRVIVRTIRSCSEEILKKLSEIDAKCDIIIKRTEQETGTSAKSSLQLELDAHKELAQIKAQLEAARNAASGESIDEYAVSDFNGSI